MEKHNMSWDTLEVAGRQAPGGNRPIGANCDLIRCHIWLSKHQGLYVVLTFPEETWTNVYAPDKAPMIKEGFTQVQIGELISSLVLL